MKNSKKGEKKQKGSAPSEYNCKTTARTKGNHRTIPGTKGTVIIQESRAIESPKKKGEYNREYNRNKHYKTSKK